MTILRSALYMPGINRKAMDKALKLDCDAVILDLEDAVDVSKKEESRQLVKRQIENNDYGSKQVIVRVNDLNTKWGKSDVAAFANSRIQAILVPKVSEIGDISRIAEVLNEHGSELPVWIMVETPLAMININELVRQPRVSALVMGTSDLVTDLGAEHMKDRHNLSYALQRSVVAARAFAKLILDGVHLDFWDLDSFHDICRLGRSMGFDGKTLIHPDQIIVANQVFSPSEAELEKAKRVIDAWRTAQAQGSGVVELEGSLVESLHVEEAKRLLDVVSEIAHRTD